MKRSGTAVTTAIAVAVALLLAPGAGIAQAKVTAKVSVVESDGGARVVAVLRSTKKLSGRARVRSVRVRQGSATWTLTRARSASAARTYALGTWRTGKLTGDRARRAVAIRGAKVSVLVRSQAGRTTTVRTTAATPAPAGGGGTTPAPGGGTTPAPGGGSTTPAPLFTPPGRDLSGQEAIASMGKYFVNSEFSDCPQGHWPACTVENRYGHLEDGTFIYRRCTPTSGSDINFVNSYQVTGAAQRADGSWVIEYLTSGGDGFYHWEVGQDGVVNGYYQFQGGAPELLQNYVWRQPAYAADCYGS